ncbi:recombinase RarA, partial [Limosilactobacillus fermentum]|nr:recombinase RarA [Limosilactobacillus fermentum]
VNQGNSGAVPDHLKDAHYQGAQKLGRGVTYRYPHDYPEDWVAQQYLPDRIKNDQYYQPKQNGTFERAFAKQYRQLLAAQRGQQPPQR